MPEILDTVKDDHSLSYLLNINEDVIFFNGHFENNPILPGVTQIHWVMKLLQQHFDFKFKTLEQVKFIESIAPNTRLTLNLKINKLKVFFEYINDQQLFSKGVISIIDHSKNKTVVKENT